MADKVGPRRNGVAPHLMFACPGFFGGFKLLNVGATATGRVDRASAHIPTRSRDGKDDACCNEEPKREFRRFEYNRRIIDRLLRGWFHGSVSVGTRVLLSRDTTGVAFCPENGWWRLTVRVVFYERRGEVHSPE